MQPEIYDVLSLYVNSLVTSIIGFYVFYLLLVGKVHKHSFYWYMGIGFLFYGAEIAVRGLIGQLYLQILMFLILSLMFYVSISLGLWSLTKKRSSLYMLVATYATFSSLIILWAIGYPSSWMLLNAGSLISFSAIITLVFQHRTIFGQTVDKFLFGWMLLLISNFLLYGSGWIVDVLAIFSKLIILYGVTGYDFAIISQRLVMEREKPILPLSSGRKKEGGFMLVTSRYGSAINDLPWISDIVKKSINQDLITYLFVFQDILPYSELRRIKWIKPDMISIFIFSSRLKKEDEEFIVLRMDLSDIGSSISEISEYQRRINKNCVILLLDISQLIHFFNASPIYKMLLSKMGLLRETGITVFGIIRPETHLETNILPLFTSIADNVLET